MLIGNENCLLCKLYATRKKVVRNNIYPEAEIACISKVDIIEDTNGVAFSGSGGKLIKTILINNHIDVNTISYLNVLQCIYDKFDLQCYSVCKDNLIHSLSLMKNLKVVLLFGVDVCQAITGKKNKMESIYLHPLKLPEWKDVLFIPLHHPGYLLAAPNESNKKLFSNGIEQAIKIYQAVKELTSETKSIILDTEENLKKGLEILLQQKYLSFDTEFTTLNWWEAKILSFHFSFQENTSISIPFRYWDGNSLVYFWSKEINGLLINYLSRILNSAKISGCNLKIDSLVCRQEFGFPVIAAFDITICSFLLNSSLPTSLEEQIVREIPEKAGRKGQFWGKKEDIKKDWYKNINYKDLLSYGGDDAMDTLRITKILSQKL